MKLGDAGEAFFVELKDDESMVAPYLCTSPLPAEDAQKLMERGLEEMRSQCDANQVPFYTDFHYTRTFITRYTGRDYLCAHSVPDASAIAWAYYELF